MKNRVIKLVDIGRVEIFEEEVLPLSSDEILVKIMASGICGSDLHYFRHGGLGSFKQPLPMHMGHEPSGIVVDPGRNKKFKPGDRVAVEPGRSCVTSRWSLKGRHNLCTEGSFMGATSPGALSDYVKVSDLQLCKIPNSMSFETASLLEPLSVALHAVNLISPHPTNRSIIFGAGPVGLCLMLVLEKFGIENIFLVDKLKYRCDFAKEMGATDSFHLKDSVEDVSKKIKKLTDGEGVQVLFDAAGNNESIDGCVQCGSISSKIGLVGIPEEDYLLYNPHKMRTKEMSIFNIRRSNRTLDDCVTMFSRDSDRIEKMVTHKFSLEETQIALEKASFYRDNIIKCMITH